MTSGTLDQDPTTRHADTGPGVRYPATAAQEAIWVNGKLSPRDTLYNLQWRLRLSGHLERERVVLALQTIVNRHESLRTYFQENENGLEQIVAPFLKIDCPLSDLSSLPNAERRLSVAALERDLGSYTFDLQSGPLFRFHLIQLDRSEHHLMVLIHHLVTDGTSWPIIVSELTALYGGEHLPPLPLQYGAYAVGQKETAARGGWDSHRAFWRDRLAGTLPALTLPAVNSRPATRSFKGGICHHLLSSGLRDQLKSLAKENGSSLFRMLCAAFVVLLHRLTGEEDIVVGTAMTGRKSDELKGLIGMFVNTAALRVLVGRNDHFIEVLGRVHEELHLAEHHEEYPFTKVAEGIRPLRNPGREPIIPVNFVKLPKSEEKTVDGVVFGEERIFLDSALNDVTFYTQEVPEGIRIVCEYAGELFDADTMERFLGCYALLLGGIGSGSRGRIAELPLVTADERHKSIFQWHDTDAESPVTACVPQLV